MKKQVKTEPQIDPQIIDLKSSLARALADYADL